ncbi:hypothetical protein MGYG_03237 [Nannizzia gypsea CBS 118893]|uniref:Uncharacterized protein n=1 Tax=Arthroderma gypseum (strain ATCC MYA-4604 / CBS 118893) TaxID=535722 RepID=E4URM4_ARTGP|nr:hypothetical protein MGYG_03237 [Nannizzia gypsea CBS 118893]EFR00234.1 hypothetical protein MGYG_03237 [Nannizzia gypsea CBS 118893]
MSDSREPGKPGGDKEKEDTLTKYIQRMKTALKGPRRPADMDRRPHLAARPRAAAPADADLAADPTAPAATTPSASPSHSQGPGQGQPPAPRQWTSMQEERARALFAKYGLTLEPGEWITGPATGLAAANNINNQVERIEKPIRMRVRRNCHRCLATFGADKVCVKCEHTRCKKCFRYPPSKSETTSSSEPKRERVQKKIVNIMLTIPSRTGGQDLVRKPVRQRVRRTCHVCSTLFEGSATECLNCHHLRCKKCPRDPAKIDKYPDGYPGDAEPPFEPQERIWRKPRRRVRWTCHECSSMFTGGEKICLQCHHERCGGCIRDPPKKIKPEPDPEILRRVEEKLALIDVSS